MRLALKLHPDSRKPAAAHIDVEVARPAPARLSLRYVVSGDVSALAMPRAAAPSRADELWRRTCFEAFLIAPPATAYYELNLSPSTQWAAYRFNGYRSGMEIVDEITPPRLETHADAERCELHAALHLSGLSDLPSDAAWRLGLSAIIEAANGEKSYWALKHPPGKPDFHHPDCFALELPPA